MDGKEIIGARLFNVTVSLCTRRHFGKVGRYVESMHDLCIIRKGWNYQCNGNKRDKHYRHKDFAKRNCFHFVLLDIYLFFDNLYLPESHVFHRAFV